MARPHVAPPCVGGMTGCGLLEAGIRREAAGGFNRGRPQYSDEKLV
jgi:hypothetical protein